MRLVLGFGVGTLAAVAIMAADMASGIRTASAQGGIVCEYGTARYKRCCRESYRNNPDLGPRGRARDIDACMSRDSSREPESGERKTSRTKEDREPASAGLRRVDCSADGCNGGCAADEVVVSAFCPSGAPTLDGDRDVKCAEGRERPAVLVCAKR
jgi:hypothetical protein